MENRYVNLLQIFLRIFYEIKVNYLIINYLTVYIINL
jgi:hypothetical protein